MVFSRPNTAVYQKQKQTSGLTGNCLTICRRTRKKKVLEHTPDIVEVYLRADKNLDRQTAEALSQLFRNAYENYMKSVRKG